MVKGSSYYWIHLSFFKLGIKKACGYCIFWMIAHRCLTMAWLVWPSESSCIWTPLQTDTFIFDIFCIRKEKRRQHTKKWKQLCDVVHKLFDFFVWQSKKKISFFLRQFAFLSCWNDPNDNKKGMTTRLCALVKKYAEPKMQTRHYF